MTLYNIPVKTTFLLSFSLLASLFHFASTAHAGALQDAIDNEVQKLTEESVGNLEKQAMDARVKATRSALFPSVRISGTEAQRRQSIRAEQNSLILSGDNTFDNRRYMAILEQPLFDREKTSALDEAKVYAEFASQTVDFERQQVISGLLAAYLEIAKGKEIDESFTRTLTNLEREHKSAQKKLDLKLITSGQLNTIKLHLLNATKNRDLSNSDTARARSFMDARLLGGAAAIPTVADNADLHALTIPAEDQLSRSDADIISLNTDIALLKARAKKEKAKRLPKINLVALYEYDDAAETVFGGPSRIEDYEVGIVLQWDLFKGGYSKHKVQEIKFLQRAKEQRLNEALAGVNSTLLSHSGAFQDALARLTLERDMMTFRKQVLDATVKGFSVGEQDYLGTIDAALLYEESRRNQIEAKYKVLTEFVAAHRLAGSLSSDAVPQIESLFEQQVL
ncbi:TolC family protein [Arenicella xantha]|uniref:Outer membrane protein TolC n=1 Tax=Arenicella xantha TaxID=644221 RepID=A0A395JM58_9GAMM|nr:TolC family protein [Arenicella xantha]RBP50748.1 outer membrane protein TolC [Arenicella xantha]